MPLIEFPNVPIAPGVPNIRRSIIGIGQQTGILSAIEGADVFGLLDGIMGPRWGIYDATGALVIEPDSVVAFDYRGEHMISKYPVEDGSFSSYNKVARPYDIRLLMSCDGKGRMTKEQFLQTLELMRESTDLYDLVTPDFAYENVNLIGIDYRRQSSGGVSLLLVDVRFEEVRVTATAVYSSKEPAGAKPASGGSVGAAEPATEQKSAIGKFADGVKAKIQAACGVVGSLVKQAEATYKQAGSYVGGIAQQGKKIIDEVGGVAIELQDEVRSAAKSALSSKTRTPA